MSATWLIEEAGSISLVSQTCMPRHLFDIDKFCCSVDIFVYQNLLKICKQPMNLGLRLNLLELISKYESLNFIFKSLLIDLAGIRAFTTQRNT